MADELTRDWAWVIMPTLADAQRFRDELAGTIGIDPDVPAVLLGDPIPLTGGRAGWCSHYWAATEASRDMIEILATHSRYKGVVHFGRSVPSEWQPEEPPVEEV